MVQSPSTFLNSPCHYYPCPIIDTLLIKKPYHSHLAMNLRAESQQNQICSQSSNEVPTRTTRIVGNILFSTFTCPRFRTIASYRVWADVKNKRLHPDRSSKIKFYLRQSSECLDRVQTLE